MGLLDGKGPQYETQCRPIPTVLCADPHTEPLGSNLPSSLRAPLARFQESQRHGITHI